MAKQKQYSVVWTIDVEDENVNSPVEAVEECWKRLHEHDNDWIWVVTDLQTKEVFEVDMEMIGPLVSKK